MENHPYMYVIRTSLEQLTAIITFGVDARRIGTVEAALHNCEALLRSWFTMVLFVLKAHVCPPGEGETTLRAASIAVKHTPGDGKRCGVPGHLGCEGPV